MRAVHLGLLRHEPYVRAGAHRLRIEGLILLAELNDLVKDDGVAMSRQEHDAGPARLLEARGALAGVGVAVRLGVRRPLSQGVRVLVGVLFHRHRGFVTPRTESTGATAPRAG